ncbi:MAG: HAE1 family hydrophobic/amphiphilic exporter-1, partial [bacterium]
MKFNPIRFFANHPTAANLLMFLMIALGVLAIPFLQRETFPRFTSGKVQIQIIYPGATAKEIEESICQKIEDALANVSNIDEIQCASQEGAGTSVVTWDEKGDYQVLLDDIKREIDAITTFPENAEDAIIQSLNRKDAVVSIAITGKMSPSDLKAYARTIKDRFLKHPSISQITLQGFSDHQIRIEIPARTLKKYNLSIADIANTIKKQSLNLPAGSIKTKNQDILVRFSDERKTPSQFESLLIVGTKSGSQIRLGDIAKIYDRFENKENKFFFNGERTVILNITKNPSEDVITIGNIIKKLVAKEQAKAPKGVKFTLTKDVFSVVVSRLQLLVTNGWQGMILVMLTLWLFFNVRFAF